MILFFDTETTGFLRRGYTPPTEARVCQLAGILVTNAGEPVEELNAIIRPDGWTIPSQAAAVHGITTERATEEGQPMGEVLLRFNSMVAKAETMAAYNLDFDAAILQRESRLNKVDSDFPQVKTRCVLEMAKPVCRIPPTPKMIAAGYLSYKNPKLGEAYRALFGREMNGAHDALADVKAAMEVYFHIQNLFRQPKRTP